MQKFSAYDVVRIERLPARDASDDAFNLRPPRVGDIATIIEIYTDPPGYELECSGQDGITQWLIAFSPGEMARNCIPCCELRYFFDPGSGICLWSANNAARERYGYPVALDVLDLPPAVVAHANALIERFDTSIDRDDPAGASPWSDADAACFVTDAAALLECLRGCLGPRVIIVDENKVPPKRRCP